MKNKGVSALIIIFVILGLLFAGGLLLDNLDEKHESDLILAAQNTELGEGVTLRQGVRAYFGDDGHWDVVDDTVHLMAGDIFDGHSLDASFKVDQKADNLDIVTFYYDGYAVSQNELYEIIDAMIQAVKK